MTSCTSFKARLAAFFAAAAAPYPSILHQDASRFIVSPPDRHIPISVDELVATFRLMIDSPSQRRLLDELTKLLEGLFMQGFIDARRRLNHEFAPFSCGAKGILPLTRAGDSLPTQSDLDRKEQLLLKEILALMSATRFKLLDKRALALACQDKFLFALPVKVDWGVFDRRPLKKLWQSSPELRQARERLPRRSRDRALVFHRGVGVAASTGRFFEGKMDLAVEYLLMAPGQRVWEMTMSALRRRWSALKRRVSRWRRRRAKKRSATKEGEGRDGHGVVLQRVNGRRDASDSTRTLDSSSKSPGEAKNIAVLGGGSKMNGRGELLATSLSLQSNPSDSFSYLSSKPLPPPLIEMPHPHTKFIERRTLRILLPNFKAVVKNFFKELTLQEAVFKEVVIVYRTKHTALAANAPKDNLNILRRKGFFLGGTDSGFRDDEDDYWIPEDGDSGRGRTGLSHRNYGKKHTALAAINNTSHRTSNFSATAAANVPTLRNPSSSPPQPFLHSKSSRRGMGIRTVSDFEILSRLAVARQHSRLARDTAREESSTGTAVFPLPPFAPPSPPPPPPPAPLAASVPHSGFGSGSGSGCESMTPDLSYESRLKGILGRRNIFVKSFRDIPISDLDIIFSNKHVFLKPLTIVQIIATVILAVVGGLVLIWRNAGRVTVGFFWTFFTTVAARCGQVYSKAQIERGRAVQSMATLLYERSGGAQEGVLAQLLEDRIDQRLKEAVMAYTVLLLVGEGCTMPVHSFGAGGSGGDGEGEGDGEGDNPCGESWGEEGGIRGGKENVSFGDAKTVIASILAGYASKAVIGFGSGNYGLGSRSEFGGAHSPDEAARKLSSLTQRDLDGACEAILEKAFSIPMDFAVEDALPRILDLGIVKRIEGIEASFGRKKEKARYQAVPLEEAVKQLEKLWQGSYRNSGGVGEGEMSGSGFYHSQRPKRSSFVESKAKGGGVEPSASGSSTHSSLSKFGLGSEMGRWIEGLVPEDDDWFDEGDGEEGGRGSSEESEKED